jgi:hypothetical protein
VSPIQVNQNYCGPQLPPQLYSPTTNPPPNVSPPPRLSNQA